MHYEDIFFNVNWWIVHNETTNHPENSDFGLSWIWTDLFESSQDWKIHFCTMIPGLDSILDLLDNGLGWLIPSFPDLSVYNFLLASFLTSRSFLAVYDSAFKKKEWKRMLFSLGLSYILYIYSKRFILYLPGRCGREFHPFLCYIALREVGYCRVYLLYF